MNNAASRKRASLDAVLEQRAAGLRRCGSHHACGLSECKFLLCARFSLRCHLGDLPLDLANTAFRASRLQLLESFEGSVLFYPASQLASRCLGKHI